MPNTIADYADGAPRRKPKSKRLIDRWVPPTPEDAGDMTSGGWRTSGRDDRSRPRDMPTTSIGIAASPKKGGISNMPIIEDLPDDPKIRKKSPIVRGV